MEIIVFSEGPEAHQIPLLNIEVYRFKLSYLPLVKRFAVLFSHRDKRTLVEKVALSNEMPR
jgi:hypothetical protein